MILHEDDGLDRLLFGCLRCWPIAKDRVDPSYLPLVLLAVRRGFLAADAGSMRSPFVMLGVRGPRRLPAQWIV